MKAISSLFKVLYPLWCAFSWFSHWYCTCLRSRWQRALTDSILDCCICSKFPMPAMIKASFNILYIVVGFTVEVDMDSAKKKKKVESQENFKNLFPGVKTYKSLCKTLPRKTRAPANWKRQNTPPCFRRIRLVALACLICMCVTRWSLPHLHERTWMRRTSDFLLFFLKCKSWAT